MKKILTTLIAITSLTVASFAQRTTDVSVVLVSPSQNTIVNCTDSFLVEYLFINNGPDTILTADTIYFQDPEVSALTNVYYSVPEDDAAPGDTIANINFYINLDRITFLFNSSNNIAEAPFANGDYGFFAFYVGFGATSDITDSDTTNNIDLKMIKIDCATGINNLAKANLNIFPNPAQGQITVNFEALASNATLRVIDIMGRTILTKEVAKNTSAYAFDISALNNGAYYLELTSGEVRGTSKFVVSK